MTRPLWTADEIEAALKDRDAVKARDFSCSGVSIDTRTLEPGDLFVALKDQRDGHEFVTTAFEKGAAAALVAQSYSAKPGDGALISVADVLTGLEALAVASRSRVGPQTKIVAVTGSAGKTGTKEMLRACLSKLGATHASEKSYNNHWGVPLTLARMPADTQFGVFEIGMNHAGEIRPLSKFVKPHAAIVTTVEAVHLEHFPSVEAIADAKSEIFEGLLPGGAAIIKYDNPHAARLKAAAARHGARAVTFGFNSQADVSASDVRFDDEGTSMTVTVGGRNIPVRLSIPGRHIAENALAVAAALDAIGADVEIALGVLATIAPPSGRGARQLLSVAGGEALLIDESYNANPASMRAALATLGTVPRERFCRRIAVLGDMLELGPNAQRLHSGLKDAVEEAGIDLIFACGPYMKGLYDALPAAKRGGYALVANELEPGLASQLSSGDVVMVKASNGTRLGPVVAALKARFGSGGGA